MDATLTYLVMSGEVYVAAASGPCRYMSRESQVPTSRPPVSDATFLNSGATVRSNGTIADLLSPDSFVVVLAIVLTVYSP